MTRVRIDAIFKEGGDFTVGSKVTVEGWVRSRRDSKAGLSFIALSDGSCFATLQLVAKSDLENYESEIKKLTTGCSVSVDGTLVESKGKGQSLELAVEAVRVIGWVDDPETYPVSQKRHTFEYLREVAHLRTRTNTFGAVMRVRNCVAQAVHRFFHERGFLWIHTPIITASDAEGAGQMFRVTTQDPGEPVAHDPAEDFFGKKTFLTVSGQLSVETCCESLGNVYTFGPTFRAENSHTARHLAEFWMIEPELAFCDLAGDAALAAEFLQYLIRAVLAERPDDMQFFDDRIEKGIIGRLEKVAESEFLRLPYTEAIEVLEKSGEKFEYPVKWGSDLQTEHERYLTEKKFAQPVIVTDYPAEIKAFYMRMNDDGKTVAAMDVLVPGVGEIIGGSQREERLEVLDARIEAMGLPVEEYGWYRDLRRYGTIPHAGFGLGFERFIMYATGMQNIRDVIPFPRTPNWCEF